MVLNSFNYNMHSLIHLAQDAQTFDLLDSVSAFPFETFLGKQKETCPSASNVVSGKPKDHVSFQPI